MNRELVEKWVAALRSGEYEQTTLFLRSECGHCCIGVAHDIHPDADWLYFDDLETETLPEDMEFDYGLLTELVHPVTGDTKKLKYVLSSLNDKYNYSFSKIADYIEATLLK